MYVTSKQILEKHGICIKDIEQIKFQKSRNPCWWLHDAKKNSSTCSFLSFSSHPHYFYWTRFTNKNNINVVMSALQRVHTKSSFSMGSVSKYIQYSRYLLCCNIHNTHIFAKYAIPIGVITKMGSTTTTHNVSHEYMPCIIRIRQLECTTFSKKLIRSSCCRYVIAHKFRIVSRGTQKRERDEKQFRFN